MRSGYRLTLQIEVDVTTDRRPLSQELRDKVVRLYSSAVHIQGQSVEDGEYEVFGKDACFVDEPCQVSSQQNLTAAEREAIAYYLGTGGPYGVDATLVALLSRTGSDGEKAADEATRCRKHGKECPERERLEELRAAADQADAEYREEIARLRLTAWEREAIEMAASVCDASPDIITRNNAAMLRSILGRTVRN